MKNKKILISGAGIAGLTAAYWLKRYGFEPTLVEVAPGLRMGGYMIDFWGAGFRVAEKMGLAEKVRRRDHCISELIFVNEHSKRVGGFRINKKLLEYRFVNLLRGDLVEILFERVSNEVPILFNNTIVSIAEKDNGVEVQLRDGSTQHFDLLIGADGLHSLVRTLSLESNEKTISHFMGYYVASFTIDNYFGKEDLFVSYSDKGKQVGLYGLPNSKLAAFFIYKTANEISFDHRNRKEQEALLRDVFSSLSWECPRLMEKMEESTNFYFDTVSQIRLDRWYSGRVALVGDACQCLSLLSGYGSSMAMVGAYVLAGELYAHDGDYTKAFQAYQTNMKPEVERRQQIAEKFAWSFVPSTQFGVAARNVFTRALRMPCIDRLVVRRLFSDGLELLEY